MRRSHRLVVGLLAAVIGSTLSGAVATVAVRRPAPQAASPSPAAPRGVQALVAATAPGERAFGVATFRSRPSAGEEQGLRALGLEVQRLRHLPLALVAGTTAQLESAVRRGVAADVYPNEKLRYLSAESTTAMRADRVRARGFTGQGVGVAIVDSGVDATHPDLADHVTRNVKMVGPEHLDALGGKAQPDDPPGTLVVAMDQTPYNNSDTTIGHGTPVAGVVAADAHTSPSQVGVAPDASIIGYGAGDAISIFTILAAFDDVLAHRQTLGIRVVNNSWSHTGAKLFDPADPVNVATKALHDAGVVVVFSAGNDGEEATLNAYSVAPWVISAGATTVSRQRSDFSSGGYEYDNSEAAALGEDRYQRFDGDRVGLYHPDVSSPGTDIVASGTPTGVYVNAAGGGAVTPPGGTVTVSGTSFSAPHVAGLAALLFQARPSLTPDQVGGVLQVTAVPLGDSSPFWRAGYGFTDAQAAVDLVLRPDFGPDLLGRLQQAADARVLADRPFAVRTSELWSFTPELPVSAAGAVTRTFDTVVAPETKAVKAVVSYPSLGLVGANPFDWQVTLRDAAGKVVATSKPSEAAGVSTLFVDLADASVTYGKWKVEVAGLLGATDNEQLVGNAVTLALTQLEPQTRVATATGPVFSPSGARSLFFQPGATPAGPLPSPEGCASAPGSPQGRMADGRFPDACWSAQVGFALNHGADAPAQFVTAAPMDEVVVGGPSSFTLWLVDPSAQAWTQAGASRISYTLEAVDATGRTTPVAAGDVARLVDGPDEVGAEPTRAEYGFDVPPTTVPAGSNLRLRLKISGVYTSTMRMVFGGKYADAGMTLGTGRFVG